MDVPEDSHSTEKSWDHPWTTDEMRENKDDWSLAADVGLLKHLQQFSDNLTQQVCQTKEKLNSLTDELEESSVIIDNLTNASLALANTQFIESRVYEDDLDIDGSKENKASEKNNKEDNKDDLIARVSESIKQGLNIMDEKFQRLEVSASDSEDEGEIPALSVILQPKDPYENRPLPYIIGSEKWKSSNNVGLELSSDSETQDGDEDSTNKVKENLHKNKLMSKNRRESSSRRSSSSSSSKFSVQNDVSIPDKDYSSLSSRMDKMDARSEDILNSDSEIATPSIVQPREENPIRGAPSFAEELAKRLGNVLPNNRTVKDNQDADQASINRFKDDLFAADGSEVFDTKSENLFDDDNNLFDEDISTNLWKTKPYRPPISNIIPPSLDVPPPMTTEASKPKSAFDDLCGDPESEDSDSIFVAKSSSIPTNSISANDDKRDDRNSKENKFLNVARSENFSNMATSTPEINDNGGLFGDGNDYEDDDALFGRSISSRNRTTERSPELARAANRTMPPGLSITQSDILSSNLGSRLFQRVPRQASSDSSDTESSVQNSDPRGDSNVNERIVQESDSSGISVRPNNNTINNTFGLSVDFQPQLESTRLRSEEIYRERYPSDSLFEGRTRQPENTNSTENSSVRIHERRIINENVDSAREDDFDIDDVFEPPPLPAKQNDSKSKSEFTSNDDLFSNSSSESRSHKSFDPLAVGDSHQYDAKSTSEGGVGLFDEDIDIFGRGDAPEIDIFGEAFKSSKFSPRESSVGGSSPKTNVDSKVSSTKNDEDNISGKVIENQKTSLAFDDSKTSVGKTRSIFDDSEDEDNETDDLFGTKFLRNDLESRKSMLEADDDEIFTNKASNAGLTAFNETKKDSTSFLARENVANEATNEKLTFQTDDNQPTMKKALPSNSSSGLFDNLEENDSDDCLFAPKESPKVIRNEKEEKKNVEDGENFDKSKIAEFGAEERNVNTIEKKSLEKESIDDENISEDRKKDSQVLSEETKPEILTSRKEDDSMEKKVKDDREISMTDGCKISKAQNIPEVGPESTRRDPPKTLSIRLPTTTSDDSSQAAPRRAVSGKIKNLMGKMGDLKILSPTDTPPLWRKSEEKADSDHERVESRDSEDGSSMSAPTIKSPTPASGKVEENEIFPETAKEPSPNSPLEDSGNSESAVSFDLPAQVEVLAVAASKSRARIQAKRRPQSRHARQSALRKSGIDFDTVDNPEIETVESDSIENTISSISEKIPTVVTGSVDVDSSSRERFSGKENEAEKLLTEKMGDPISSLVPEDRSELSFSKGSSMSLNKNTLLSPSTDEEDLFDVPPDLPEDPPKEDTLFGRAPILSPIDRLLVGKNTRSKERSREKDSRIPDSQESENSKVKEQISEERTKVEKSLESDSTTEKLTDPLRDDSHDPLKDPSQLFAFVTKTPSPEKGQNVLFKEDASLFTHLAKKSAEEARSALKKPIPDLFAEDSVGDLFSGNLTKSSKKSTRSVKSNSLFDDIDNTEEDAATSLFGVGSKSVEKKIEKIDESMGNKSRENSTRASPHRGSIFTDDHDDLFVDTMEKKSTLTESEKTLENKDGQLFQTTIGKTAKENTKIADIFGDESSGEEDLFAKKKIIGSGKIVGASGSLFSDARDTKGDDDVADDDGDDDADDIFGTKKSTRSKRVDSLQSRASSKKVVTRDLKKTAETIVKDPLSMLQDD